MPMKTQRSSASRPRGFSESMDFAHRLNTSARKLPHRSPETTHKHHISVCKPHEEIDEEEIIEDRRPKSRNGSRSRRSSSSTTEALTSFFKERLSFETGRVSQLTAEVDDHKRSYAMLQTKYSALQMTCTQLQLDLENYRVRFDAQQTEIYKAQDVVADVNRRRRDAEHEAVRGRQKVRDLKTDIAVRSAKDGGWRTGFHQGAREAGLLFGGMLGRNKQRDEVLDEEKEERRAAASRKRSSSRSRPQVQASSSSGSGSSSVRAPTPQESTLPRPDTPGITMRSALSSITRRHSFSRHRSRSRSVSDVNSPVSYSTAPEVPVLPARPPSRPQPPSEIRSSGRHRTAVVNDTEDGHLLPIASSVSETSTRISEYELVSPPRPHVVQRPEEPGTPTPHSALGVAQEDLYFLSRRFDNAERPRTSQGYRPSTPHERVGYNERSASRLETSTRPPLSRNQPNIGMVHINIQPPSQSSSDPSSASYVDPILLSPDAEYEPPRIKVDKEYGPNTPGLLEQLSRDNDTSYFPFDRKKKTTSDMSEERSSHVPSRSSTPRTPRPSYDAAPVPPGVVYPQPPIRRGSTPGSSPGSSSSSSAPSTRYGKRVPHRQAQTSLSGVSPATLNRPFSIFSEDS